MTNVCFVVLTISAIFEGYLRGGLFTFMAKYMEAEYHTSASVASYAKGMLMNKLFFFFLCDKTTQIAYKQSIRLHIHIEVERKIVNTIDENYHDADVLLLAIWDIVSCDCNSRTFP